MQTKPTKNKKAPRETSIILIVDINSPCENNLVYIWFHVYIEDYGLFPFSRTIIIIRIIEPNREGTTFICRTHLSFTTYLSRSKTYKKMFLATLENGKTDGIKVPF